MSAFQPRWRVDATGYVARFAGQLAGEPMADREQLDQIIREMPNGSQIEVVEVPDA